MRILTTSILLLMLFGCALSEHQNWSFVKSVGGLSVAGQDKNPDWLIIRGDVSGLKRFSTDPTVVNSAMAVKRVKAVIKGSNVQVYIVTTLISEEYPTTEISGVDISGVKPGPYMVQYLNPDGTTVDLEKVTIH